MIQSQEIGVESIVPAVKSDRDGRFALPVLEGCTMTLRLSAPDRWSISRFIGRSDSDLGKMVLGRAGRIEGRIAEKLTGRADPDAWIFAADPSTSFHRSPDSWDNNRSSKVDENGRYTIEGLKPGRREVAFYDKSKSQKWTVPSMLTVNIEAGKTASADFGVIEGQRLSGIVVDNETGQPIPRWEVSYAHMGPSSDRGMCARTGKTDERGRYEFYVLPGLSCVSAHDKRGGGTEASRTVEVTSGREYRDLTLRVTKDFYPEVHQAVAFLGDFDSWRVQSSDPDWRLRIRLRTPDNQPVNGVYFWVNDRTRYVSSQFFRGDRFDEALPSSMGDGDFTLRIAADGFAPR